MAERLVVDCSVATKWLLPEPGRESALELLRQYEAGEVFLLAPDLLMAEFASVLAKRNRRKEISIDQAGRAFYLMEQCAPRLLDTRSRLRKAFALPLEQKLSLWDCVYLALATEYGCPFITADRRQFRGSIARHPSIRLLPE